MVCMRANSHAWKATKITTVPFVQVHRTTDVWFDVNSTVCCGLLVLEHAVQTWWKEFSHCQCGRTHNPGTTVDQLKNESLLPAGKTTAEKHIYGSCEVASLYTDLHLHVCETIGECLLDCFYISCLIKVLIAITVMDGKSILFILSGENRDNQMAVVLHLPLIPLSLFSKYIDFHFFVGFLEVGSHKHSSLRFYFTTTHLLINPFQDACEWQTGPSMKFFMNHTNYTAQPRATTDRWKMDCGYRRCSTMRHSPLGLYSYSNQYGCLVKNKQFSIP